MKLLKNLAIIAAVVLFSSCENNDPIVLDPVASETFSNLHAPRVGGPGPGGNVPISGPFTKFDFETGDITTDPNDWDIAFRATTIIVNGGVSFGSTDEPERTGGAAVYISTDGFASVTEVDESLFQQDSEAGYAIPSGGGNGWYDYTPGINLITPKAGLVLVLRTTEGKFVKMQIDSYYKDAPDNVDTSVDTPRYYTFNYVYQPNDGVTTFE